MDYNIELKHEVNLHHGNFKVQLITFRIKIQFCFDIYPISFCMFYIFSNYAPSNQVLELI